MEISNGTASNLPDNRWCILYCVTYFICFFPFHCIRLQALEKSFILENGETSSVVQDIKLKVDSFREKLEVCIKFFG